jgi:DNA-binding HxlR family transcriptional regulator
MRGGIDGYACDGRREVQPEGDKTKALWQVMPEKSPGQLSRILKRLRLHGLIKKIGKTCLYYLTEFGKQVTVTCLKLKNMFLVPDLSRA